MRKGLSLFLEAVLIVMITMATAIIVSKWYKSFSESQTAEIEEHSATSVGCDYQTVGVDRIVYDVNASKLEVVLRATGTKYVAVHKISVINSSYYQKDYVNGNDFFLKRIAPDDTEAVTLENLIPNVTEVRVILKDCGMNSITIRRDEMEVV